MRLLYVEDNEVDAELARLAFERSSPETELSVATTLAEGRARLEKDLPDVLLTDLNLPDGSGLDLLVEVRECRLPMAVVIVTGAGDQEFAVAAIKMGADDYVVKQEGYLERLAATARNALAHFREREARMARPLRVLYVERSESDIDLVRRHLERYAPHIRIDAVGDAGEALARLPMTPDGDCAYDVVLMDYRLPGIDALDALKILRQERRLAIPVVLITGQGSEEVAARAFHLGADDYMTKHQAYLHELPSTLENAFRKGELIRERAALRESEARMRQAAMVFENTRDGVVIADLDANVLAVNRAFTEITGYAEAEMLGRNPRLIQSGRQGRDFYQAMWAALAATGQWQGEIWNRRKNGEVYPEWLTINVVRDERGAPSHYVGVFTDISKLKHGEEQLEHLAHYDPLTDLPNRLLLNSRLTHSIERAERHGHRIGVLFIDLDHFKTINDSFGHTVGDELLVAVVGRLRGRLREEDTLGRLGGDEFLLLLEPVGDPQEVAVVARDLLAALAEPFRLPSGHEVFAGASIGIGVFPEDGATATELLRDADAAMYRAKEQGRNRFCFYTADMNADALARLETESALRHAIERDELLLHYQPKVDLRSGRIAGAEALIRWRRDGEIVPPASFIPLAERTGLIVAIGGWVIDAACRQMRTWLDEGLKLCVAVNVSPRQFHAGDLAQVVAGALARHGVPAECLELELTESMLMEDREGAAVALDELRALGASLSLDDFGTGYSSFGYLSRFAIDALKIDQSFVRGVATEPDAALIAVAIIDLAHRMRLRVVAEGVETEAQLGYLRSRGCDQMQGYLFSRPLPVADFAEMLRQDRTLPAAAREGAETRSLLIVDDERGVLSALRRALRGEGYRVLAAGSAMEGLELLAQNDVQVILSDQRMPEMSGTEFLNRAKDIYPDTVRIVLSGYTDLESVTRAVNEGAIYKFLTKPWDDDRLREHIRDAFLYHEMIVKPRAAARSG